MDCGDRAAVSIIFTLCVANPPGSEPSQNARTPGRQSVRAQNKDGRRPPPPQEARIWIGLLGFDWVSETGRGGGKRRKERETQRDKGLPKVTKGCRGLPRVTESGLPRLRTESRVRGEDDCKLKVKIRNKVS